LIDKQVLMASPALMTDEIDERNGAMAALHSAYLA